MKDINKILLISHEMTYTGAPRSLLNLARVLIKIGYKISVWSLADGNFKNEFEILNLNVRIVNIQECKKENVIKKFDLIILNTFFTAELCQYMQLQTRTILYLREAENIPDLVINCGLKTRSIKEAREILCVSEYAKEFIQNHYHPQKIGVVHNYVKDEYKKKLNLVKSGIIHYAIIGTIEPRKGQDNVVQAFLQMPEQLRKITKLHLIGRKPEWSSEFWRDLIPEGEERIIYHGEIRNVRDRLKLYEQMNVFIVASRDEACSLVALEGAMLGKALLLSSNVGAKYLDISGDTTYPTEDVEVLCRKMCELTSRKKLLLKGIEMRIKYLSTSTERQYTKKIKKIINEGIYL